MAGEEGELKNIPQPAVAQSRVTGNGKAKVFVSLFRIINVIGYAKTTVRTSNRDTLTTRQISAYVLFGLGLLTVTFFRAYLVDIIPYPFVFWLVGLGMLWVGWTLLPNRKTSNTDDKLTIIDNKIIYEPTPNDKLSLDIDRVKFIGEYTTSGGPTSDDWFFVFADTVDQWRQVPASAVDHKTFWKDIGHKLNCELSPGLFASTSWATRVIYPKHLVGQDLFIVVKSDAKQKTWWQGLVGAADDNEHIELTENVKQLFK